METSNHSTNHENRILTGNQLISDSEKIVRHFYDFFFPRLCVYCEEKLSVDEHVFCSGCFQSLEEIEPPVCEKCGAKIRGKRNKSHCTDCPPHPIFFDYAASAYNYSNQIRAILRAIKYEGREECADLAGKLMSAFFLQKSGQFHFDYIIPAPLHLFREFKRGYNQAELLARQVSRYSQINLLSRCLVRVRSTIKQSMLTPENRLSNLKGAFFVEKPEIISGKNILFIDDIMTTGSTANECSRMLKIAGANFVFVLTLARA